MLNLGGLSFRGDLIFVFAVSVIATAALLTLLYRTRLGLATRAVAQQPVAAQLCGIRVVRVNALTFVITGLLGGIAHDEVRERGHESRRLDDVQKLARIQQPMPRMLPANQGFGKAQLPAPARPRDDGLVMQDKLLLLDRRTQFLRRDRDLRLGMGCQQAQQRIHHQRPRQCARHGERHLGADTVRVGERVRIAVAQ